MSENYRLLTNNDIIKATDEFIDGGCEKWHEPDRWAIGMQYNTTVLKPARRRIEGHPSPTPEGAKVEARHWQAAKDAAMRAINAGYDDASHSGDERAQSIYAAKRNVLEQIERRATELAGGG